MFPFVAKPSISQNLQLLGAGAALILACAWLAGLLTTNYPTGREWIGWGGMGIFGLFTGIILVRAFDTQDMVRIGPSGIWYRDWSDDIIPWREITEVGVWRARGQKMILLSLVDPKRFPSSTLRGKAAAMDRALTGGDIAITLMGTDRSFDEAMAAIVEYRQ